MVDAIIACAFGAIVILLYHQLAKRYHYFLSKPIPCMRPTMLFGCSAQLFFRRWGITDQLKYMYDAFPDAKIIGGYTFVSPAYMVRDPDTIKQIAVKDFDHFSDHYPHFTSGRTDEDAGGDSLLGNSLFALRGQKWRDMRATLSPAFTGAKMRQMFELVVECGRSMVQFLGEEAKVGRRLEYEMKELFSRYGTDVIATVAFGVQVDSMRDPENEFARRSKQVLNFSVVKMVAKLLAAYVMTMVMPKMKVNIDLVESEVSDHFKRLILDNMIQRESRGIVRNDMVQILMDVKKGTLKKEERETKDAGFATVEESSVGKSTHSREWTDNELIAQCFLFFLAGFDTASTLMTFLAYELTINPDIQNCLFEEIRDTAESLEGWPLSYEALQAMEYMDMVISEALRKWPPNLLLDRYCTKDYIFDNGSGTRFLIEKGSNVTIPVFALHHDSKYFPNPERFDPERFSKENRSKINPTAYIPFGVGPRNCIGSRLALMEVKSVMYYLLKDFSLEPTEETKVPLKLEKHFQSLIAENGVWLELKPRIK